MFTKHNPNNPTTEELLTAHTDGKTFKCYKFSNATKDFTKNGKQVDLETAIRKASQRIRIYHCDDLEEYYEYVHPYKIVICN